MNAILTFPTHLAAELLQLRGEIATHQHEIVIAAEAFEQSKAVWVSHEADITRRLNAMRQRLSLLLI